MAEKVHLLLVEDNLSDIKLTQMALAEGRIANTMDVVTDGVQALDYLFQRGEHAGAARPDIVLLDLNLPKKNGKEVLQAMKEDPSLRRIPVLVLTTSKADEDIVRSYDLQAAGYVAKPIDFEDFCQVVRGLETYWFQIVRLPPR